LQVQVKYLAPHRSTFNLGFPALGLAAAAVALAGVHYVGRMADANEAVTSDHLPAMGALLQAQRGIGAVRFVTSRAVVDTLLGNDEATGLLWDARERALRQAQEGLATFDRLPRSVDEEALWKKVGPAFVEFSSDNGKVWTAIQAGDATRAARLQGEITSKLPDRFLDSFDELVELNQELAARAGADARATSALGTRVLLGIGVATLLGAGVVGILLGRAQAERAVSEARLRLFVEHAPAAIAMLDHEMRVMAVSRRWITDHGLEGQDVIGRAYREVVPEAPERWRLAHERCLGGEVETCERDSYSRRDGAIEWVRWEVHPWRFESGKVGGLLIASEVITERIRLEGRLAVASRLAAMGTLVAGVAHEINNPLAAELSDEGFALEGVTELRNRLRGAEPIDRESEARVLDDVVEALEEATASGQRIAHIVKELTTFGRADAKRARVRLADVVSQAMRWIPEPMTRHAHVRVEEGGAPDVLASMGQIAQVVVNLVTNAVKATPKGARVEVCIRTGPGSPGMSRLEVVDHGVGIDPAIQDRIFEPFFTTRPTGEGRGMGLGLAISHVIATSHGGTLTVESAVGRGSTFRLELPAAPEAA
jgi:PAS domain S-box-containing protein